MIEELGEAGFLVLENKINAQIQADKSVIATGGSAVYGEEAMRHFKKTGTVVYLKLPYEELEVRLGDLHKRGVVIKKGSSLRELYEERTPLYEKYADITVDCSGIDLRNVMELIAAQVEWK